MTKNTLNSFDITSWSKWTTPLTLSLFNTQTALVAIIIFLQSQRGGVDSSAPLCKCNHIKGEEWSFLQATHCVCHCCHRHKKRRRRGSSYVLRHNSCVDGVSIVSTYKKFLKRIDQIVILETQTRVSRLKSWMITPQTCQLRFQQQACFAAAAYSKHEERPSGPPV